MDFCKRIVALTCVVTVALTATMASALEGGSRTSVPREGRFALSLRASDTERSVIPYGALPAGIGEPGKSQIRGIMAQASYGLTEELDVSVRLGQMMWDPNLPDDPTFDYGFAWGFGVRARMPALPEDKFGLGVSYQFDRCSPDNPDIALYRGFAGRITEWQLSLDASYAWTTYFGMNRSHSCDWLGYMGVRYSEAALTFAERGGANSVASGFEEQDNVGLFLGLECDLGDDFMVGAELELLDVMGTSFSLTYRF